MPIGMRVGTDDFPISPDWALVHRPLGDPAVSLREKCESGDQKQQWVDPSAGGLLWRPY